MNAVALILVYAGTCAAALWLVSRFIRRISFLWALALALLPFVVTGKAMVTGRHFGPLNLAYASSPLSKMGGPELHRDYGNGLLTDVAFQMVPWQAAIRSDLRSGRAPLWNPFILCGDVLLGSAQPAPFHPSTVVGLLLPLATARSFAASFTLFLGALCAFIFLRDLDLAPVHSFFGAAAWMLSLHFFFWLGWPQGQTFAPLPLLFAGFRRIARGRSGGFGATAASLVLSLVGGHPESAFHVACVGGLYFLWELFFAESRGRAIARAAAAGLVAFALSAPAVLPVIEALPQTREAAARESASQTGKTSNKGIESARSAAGALFPDFYGRWPSFASPSAPSFPSATIASVGGIALALALFSVFSPRREKWPLAILAAFTLAVAAGTPGIADVVNRLPLFRLALNNRLASGTAIFLAALAAIGLEELTRATARRALVLPVLASIAAVVGGLRCGTLVRRGIDASPLGRSTAFFSGGILLLFVLWATVRRKPGPLAAAATALFLLVRVAETPRLYPSFSAADFYPSLKEIDRLPREGEPFRIAGLGNALLPNQSALYGLEDVRGYEGVTNARLAETFPLWCTPQRLWFNRVDDPSLPFLASLNARFVLADPETPVPAGWREVSRGSALSIFENPAALPRAFAPAHVRFIGNPSRTVAEMKACRDFSQTAWIESAGETSREIENGRAAVRAREDGPDFVLDVDAAAPSWIVVSETNWKGWRARENNTRFQIFFANHAFVGFRVPAGRHRVRLEYRPASFFQGIALFATTLLTLIAIAARRARGIARRRESGPRGQFA